MVKDEALRMIRMTNKNNRTEQDQVADTTSLTTRLYIDGRDHLEMAFRGKDLLFSKT